ncbi:hypothetical protein EVAR_24378_1 [Eumeta japonica]|uniref:Uncharacterized protein n=1 Tax=Eumeta variegata TaxID=151549 RepID=A0A4C1YDC8_EUMVA|nr:hypothetical protein EVAR_24378_1 [Eumeta japonica]
MGGNQQVVSAAHAFAADASPPRHRAYGTLSLNFILRDVHDICVTGGRCGAARGGRGGEYFYPPDNSWGTLLIHDT